MKLEQLTCNACGAPLEVPESANFVTCNHCSTQLAVNRTESVTCTEALDRLAGSTEELTDRLDDLVAQNAIEALDREWQQERKKYITIHKNGQETIPTEDGAVKGGIGGAIFGAFWTVFTIAIMADAPFLLPKLLFPGIGVLIIVGSLAGIGSTQSKARDYHTAEKRYLARREELLERIDL